MKFIHIADVHLGAMPDSNMPWSKERQKEIWESFESIINICNEEKVDLLLIAGDLFHKQPLIRELKEVNYYFSKLETAKVILMAGNHDFIGARSNYQGFKWNDNVHMFLKDTIETVDFPDINTTVYGLSYLTRDIKEPLYDKISIAAYNTQSSMNNSQADYNKAEFLSNDSKSLHKRIYILLAHGGDEKNIPMNRKKLLDSGFDYIALGHIHKPEIIGEKMAYAGSLEPLDRNEIGPRGYILGEITNEGERHTSIRFVKNSIREYKKLIVTVNQDTSNGALVDYIKEKIQKEGLQDIYQIYINGFRDESIHFNTEVIYPLGNIIEVRDESIPDYDFDILYKENSDNMIGMFIKKIMESNIDDKVAKKALYYGLEALLSAREG